MARARAPAVALLVLAVFLQACSTGGDPAPAPNPAPPSATLPPPHPGAAGIGDPYFPTAGNGGYDVRRYDIDIAYRPESGRLSGRAILTARLTGHLSRFNLDFRLDATRVWVNGRPAEHRQQDGELIVTPARSLVPGSTMTVRVDYAGQPADITVDAGPLGQRSPWVRTATGAVAVGQPDVAAWWFPANAHPADKARFSVTATVPAGLEAISNGRLLAGPEPAEPRAGTERVRWRWRARAPMAPYLAFVAIGQYDLVRRQTPIGSYLAAYAQDLPSILAGSARRSLERTPRVAQVLSEMFGPYPFEQLGAVVPNGPTLAFALENQTRPVYSPLFFGLGGNTQVVAHELAHQWFGDSVALRRWDDIWLNEGFATYAEWLYSERTDGRSAAEIARATYRDHPAGTSFWQIPPGAPGADNVLARPVYDRGAMALHAIRAAVGDETFFGILQAWARQHAGGNATVEQFLALAERRSGRQLDELAEAWLFSTGRPGQPPD